MNAVPLVDDLFGGPSRPAPAYFNTTHLPEPELGAAVSVAKQQDLRVLAIFKNRASEPLGPSEVWLLGGGDRRDGWLLTSVRRSICTLTKDAKLVKLKALVDGLHGRPEHQWRLVVTS